MARGPIVSGARILADENAVFFHQEPAASIAGGAAEPWPLPLSSPAPRAEGRFMFELDDLRLAVEGDGDLGSTQTTDTQHWVVFQELMVKPFPPNVACPERCNHGS